MNTGTITVDVYSVINAILSADSVVKVGGSAGVNYIGHPYPGKFINESGNMDLPFIIIHKPTATETRYTMTKKKYRIEITIETFAHSQDECKLISDGIRNALESNKDTTRYTYYMYEFMVTGDTEDFDLRGTKRIHRNVLTCQYYIWE